MRKIVVGKIEIKLPEEDYEQLLGRFNLDNVQEGDGRCNSIDIPCICASHPARINTPSCSYCPFDVFDISGQGCAKMLNMLSLRPSFAALGRDSVYWLPTRDAEAKLEITAIREWLLGLEKTR